MLAALPVWIVDLLPPGLLLQGAVGRPAHRVVARGARRQRRQARRTVRHSRGLPRRQRRLPARRGQLPGHGYRRTGTGQRGVPRHRRARAPAAIDEGTTAAAVATTAARFSVGVPPLPAAEKSLRRTSIAQEFSAFIAFAIFELKKI